MKYFEKQSNVNIFQKAIKGVSRFGGAATGKTLEKVKGARSKIDIVKNPKRYMKAWEIEGKAEKAQYAARASLLGAGATAAIGGGALVLK
jgi:hypothetical protein